MRKKRIKNMVRIEGVVLRYLFLIFSLSILTACGASKNYYATTYSAKDDPSRMVNVTRLKEGEEPVILRTRNVEKAFEELSDENFVKIGESKFNARVDEDLERDNVLSHAKLVGATHVLFSNTYNYSGTKKKHKFIRAYTQERIVKQRNGYNYIDTEYMPTDIVIPYRENVDIHEYHAIFMVKRLDD